MKLFFDHNLSPKLPSALQALYRDYTVVHLTDMFDKDVKWSRLVEQVGSVVKVYRGSFMLPVS